VITLCWNWSEETGCAGGTVCAGADIMAELPRRAQRRAIQPIEKTSSSDSTNTALIAELMPNRSVFFWKIVSTTKADLCRENFL
jgi:hypothetical protein